MTPEEIQNLSPGIRDLVVWLNARGFTTVDSGDGTNFEGGMGCAVPFAMIAIKTRPIQLIDDARSLMCLLEDRGVSFKPPANPSEQLIEESCWPTIQATYNPQDRQAIIVLYNVTSYMMKSP